MIILDHIQQGSREWHNLHRKSIGASDCSVVMENNPWKTPSKLFSEKMGIYEEKDNSSMQEGRRLEPIALANFCEKVNCEYKPIVILHDERSWQLASLDGMNESKTFFVEIKCSEKCYKDACDGYIPPYYKDQMQHQLCVTGLPMCYYFAYWNNKGIVIEVSRDDEYISNIIEKETEFYRRMVEFDPPEDKYVFRSDEKWFSLTSCIVKIDEEIERLQKERENVKKEMIVISNESNTKGNGICLTKTLRKGMIEYSKVPDIQKMDLEPYRKPSSEVWTVRRYNERS